jgi:hypothetical protein
LNNHIPGNAGNARQDICNVLLFILRCCVAANAVALRLRGGSGGCENHPKSGKFGNKKTGLSDFYERLKQMLVEAVNGTTHAKVIGIDIKYTVGNTESLR